MFQFSSKEQAIALFKTLNQNMNNIGMLTLDEINTSMGLFNYHLCAFVLFNHLGLYDYDRLKFVHYNDFIFVDNESEDPLAQNVLIYENRNILDFCEINTESSCYFCKKEYKYHVHFAIKNINNDIYIFPISMLYTDTTFPRENSKRAVYKGFEHYGCLQSATNSETIFPNATFINKYIFINLTGVLSIDDLYDINVLSAFVHLGIIKRYKLVVVCDIKNYERANKMIQLLSNSGIHIFDMLSIDYSCNGQLLYKSSVKDVNACIRGAEILHYIVNNHLTDYVILDNVDDLYCTSLNDCIFNVVQNSSVILDKQLAKSIAKIL